MKTNPAIRATRAGLPFACLALALLLGGVAAADEDFLRQAVESDQGFQELGGMLQVVTHEMELSNVFDGDELARGRRLTTDVKSLRTQEMQAILRALEKSMAELQSRPGYLKTAGEGHRRVADSLSRLAMLLAPAAENAAKQAALDKVRALAANVEPLARQVEAGQALKPEQKAASENYGDQAKNLAQELKPDDAGRRVEKAGEDLSAKDPIEAKKELDAAIRALQDELDNKSDSLAHAKETEQELKALAEELRKAKANTDEIGKMPDANKAADRAMDALVKQNEIKDRLNAANQPEASKDVAQAMDNMQAAKYDPAGQKLDEARQAVENAAKALEDQIARASQEQLNAFKEMQQLAEQLQDIGALQNRLDNLKSEQAAAMAQTPPNGQMPAADQKKLAQEMGQLAQDMNQANQQQAGQHTDDAKKNTDADQHNQAQQDLEKAGQALADARAQAEQALAQAEQKIEAGQTVADAAAIQQMQQQLGQMQQQYAQAQPQAQQAMAPQMGQLAQQMQQAALPQAAQAMQQAQQNAQQNAPPAANQAMAQAQQALAQAMAQAQLAAQAMQRPGPPGPPSPPSGQPPGPDDPNAPPGPPAMQAQNPMKKDKNFAADVAAAKARYAESNWRAALPERERQALLSGRKEPYPPQMEADVKKYYELLAE